MSNTEPVEPTVEETVDPTTITEESFDPDVKVLTSREMSYLLTQQTFTIISAIGEGLLARYRQMTTNVPPKAKKDPFNKGYLTALNDVANGLQSYQDSVTEKAIADGLLVRSEDTPDLPEPEATATDTDEKSV